MRKHYKYTKDLLEPLVSKSESIRQVLWLLNLKESGGNYCHIKKVIDAFGIDRSHFLGKSIHRGKAISKYTKESFTAKVLIKNGAGWRSHSIKLKLYSLGIKDEVCECCGQMPIWNGKRLSLHLDHIDGDLHNNELCNLAILCPNCHSQTRTYSMHKRSGPCGETGRH